jgi:hypothetical protein
VLKFSTNAPLIMEGGVVPSVPPAFGSPLLFVTTLAANAHFVNSPAMGKMMCSGY